MRLLPPVDTHAHIDLTIPEHELDSLGALVFAPTRSLDEAEFVISRKDRLTVWGIGCHPGLVGAQKSFDVLRFSELIEKTPYVSEIGLDGNSRVPMQTQEAVLNSILDAVEAKPRILSIHSYDATDRVLDCISQYATKGVILHWWLGDLEETKRAIALGCFFAINPSMFNVELLSTIPLERLLTETDHPFGDKRQLDRKPGNVNRVERLLADLHGKKVDEIRAQIWRNLNSLVLETKTGSLFPREVRIKMAAL